MRSIFGLAAIRDAAATDACDDEKAGRTICIAAHHLKAWRTTPTALPLDASPCAHILINILISAPRTTIAFNASIDA